MKRVLVAVSLLMLGGCGNIDWFPSHNSGGTPDSNSSPTAFTFQDNTITVADATATGSSLSNMVTIQGTNASGWALTLTDVPAATASAPIINGQQLLTQPYPNVKPGDTLAIVQVPSKVAGGIAITKVKLGNYTTHFKTTTTN